MVLDPPAFTSRGRLVKARCAATRRSTAGHCSCWVPGGVLISCSCSHHVSEAALLELIAEAALDTGRTLRVVERRTQSQDHPILLTVPETLYLKCLVFDVV